MISEVKILIFKFAVITALIRYVIPAIVTVIQDPTSEKLRIQPARNIKKNPRLMHLKTNASVSISVFVICLSVSKGLVSVTVAGVSSNHQQL